MKKFFKKSYSLFALLLFFLALPLEAQSDLQKDFARLAEEIRQLKQQNRELMGAKEAVDYVNQENQRVYRDLDLRMQALEDKVGKLYQLLQDNQKKSGVGSKQAYEDYQSLLNLLEAQDYRSAASGFLGFIKKHPKSEWSLDARFWAGESFYFLADYARAIKAYQAFLEKAPSHPRRPEALYRQALSFKALKKNQEAQLFFQKLKADYPKSDAAVRANVQLKRLQKEAGEPELSAASAPSAPPPVSEAAPSETPLF